MENNDDDQELALRRAIAAGMITDDKLANPYRESEARGFQKAIEILRQLSGCLCSWRAGETCMVCNRHEYIKLLEERNPFKAVGSE